MMAESRTLLRRSGVAPTPNSANVDRRSQGPSQRRRRSRPGRSQLPREQPPRPSTGGGRSTSTSSRVVGAFCYTLVLLLLPPLSPTPSSAQSISPSLPPASLARPPTATTTATTTGAAAEEEERPVRGGNVFEVEFVFPVASPLPPPPDPISKNIPKKKDKTSDSASADSAGMKCLPGTGGGSSGGGPLKKKQQRQGDDSGSGPDSSTPTLTLTSTSGYGGGGSGGSGGGGGGGGGGYRRKAQAAGGGGSSYDGLPLVPPKEVLHAPAPSPSTALRSGRGGGGGGEKAAARRRAAHKYTCEDRPETDCVQSLCADHGCLSPKHDWVNCDDAPFPTPSPMTIGEGVVLVPSPSTPTPTAESTCTGSTPCRNGPSCCSAWHHCGDTEYHCSEVRHGCVLNCRETDWDPVPVGGIWIPDESGSGGGAWFSREEEGGAGNGGDKGGSDGSSPSLGDAGDEKVGKGGGGPDGAGGTANGGGGGGGDDNQGSAGTDTGAGEIGSGSGGSGAGSGADAGEGGAPVTGEKEEDTGVAAVAPTPYPTLKTTSQPTLGGGGGEYPTGESEGKSEETSGGGGGTERDGDGANDATSFPGSNGQGPDLNGDPAVGDVRYSPGCDALSGGPVYVTDRPVAVSFLYELAYLTDFDLTDVLGAVEDAIQGYLQEDLIPCPPRDAADGSDDGSFGGRRALLLHGRSSPPVAAAGFVPSSAALRALSSSLSATTTATATDRRLRVDGVRPSSSLPREKGCSETAFEAVGAACDRIDGEVTLYLSQGRETRSPSSDVVAVQEALRALGRGMGDGKFNDRGLGVVNTTFLGGDIDGVALGGMVTGGGAGVGGVAGVGRQQDSGDNDKISPLGIVFVTLGIVAVIVIALLTVRKKRTFRYETEEGFLNDVDRYSDEDSGKYPTKGYVEKSDDGSVEKDGSGDRGDFFPSHGTGPTESTTPRTVPDTGSPEYQWSGSRAAHIVGEDESMVGGSTAKGYGEEILIDIMAKHSAEGGVISPYVSPHVTPSKQDNVRGEHWGDTKDIIRRLAKGIETGNDSPLLDDGPETINKNHSSIDVHICNSATCEICLKSEREPTFVQSSDSRNIDDAVGGGRSGQSVTNGRLSEEYVRRSYPIEDTVDF